MQVIRILTCPARPTGGGRSHERADFHPLSSFDPEGRCQGIQFGVEPVEDSAIDIAATQDAVPGLEGSEAVRHVVTIHAFACRSTVVQHRVSSQGKGLTKGSTRECGRRLTETQRSDDVLHCEVGVSTRGYRAPGEHHRTDTEITVHQRRAGPLAPSLTALSEQHRIIPGVPKTECVETQDDPRMHIRKRVMPTPTIISTRQIP